MFKKLPFLKNHTFVKKLKIPLQLKINRFRPVKIPVQKKISLVYLKTNFSLHKKNYHFQKTFLKNFLQFTVNLTLFTVRICILVHFFFGEKASLMFKTCASKFKFSSHLEFLVYF